MKKVRQRVIAAALSLAVVSVIGTQVVPTITTYAAGIVQSQAASELFGENVYVFGPEDSHADIQAAIDKIYSVQEKNQFGSERAAIFLKPGNYDDIKMKVGFYTQAAGLGKLPTDTTVNVIDANADWMNANSTCNFWRTAENMQVKETSTWACAQATSLRRMKFDNWVGLDQWGQGWASGGFVADTVVDGCAVAWSQQQYCSRNSDYNYWQGGVWNAVFVGMDDKLKLGDNGNQKLETNWETSTGYPYLTVVDESPLIRETPFLTVDENDNYSVFVPALRENSKGVSWKDGQADGKYIGIEDFYIAKPEKDTADTINAALASGKNLILTPGIYKIDKAIKVNNPNTVVLGLGLATLTPTGMNNCLEVADVDGVSVSGLLFDAGPDYTETLLKVGENGASKDHAANPTLLSDLFFRVGGITSGVAQSDTCAIINSNNVIGDNFWVWRADHGDGVGWDKNVCKNGLVINGDYATMYGMFVEHFNEYQTVWNGENGRLYFYQSEMPYDVPNQESWMSHDGTVNGYASYKVADNVKNHEAYGLGIYSYHRDATIDAHTAAEVPDVDGVKVENICTVMLAGNPGISHVINEEGGSVDIAGQRQQVLKYGTGNKIENPIPGSGTDTDLPTEDGDLALNKSVMASSEENPFIASAAIDGNSGTRWASAWQDNQWITVDLGAAKTISKVALNWEAAYAKGYQIQVSDDNVNWKTVADVKNSDGGRDEVSFNKTNARYVRMLSTERATGYGVSLYDFEVYK